MKTTSSKLLTASIVVMPIALFTENWVPDFYYNHGPILIYYQPLWWFSTLLLLAAIITKKIRNETPYPFSKMVILFFIQVFFGFHPLTPLPFILILAFTGFYQFYVLKEKLQHACGLGRGLKNVRSGHRQPRWAGGER